MGAVVDVVSDEIKAYRERLLAAMESLHGRKGVAQLQDAMDLEEESHEAPPLGYRRGGPEVIRIEGEVL